jgi:hypothetical protein
MLAQDWYQKLVVSKKVFDLGRAFAVFSFAFREGNFEGCVVFSLSIAFKDDRTIIITVGG